MSRIPHDLSNTGWPEFILWLLNRRIRFTVKGSSMFPILKPGDQVLIDPSAFRRRSPNVGEIVVALHPGGEALKIIKRVAKVHPDGQLDLQGENLFETTDYRAVEPGKILGKVTSIFSAHED
ncbi:MAG TPA: S24/S26 family peptidase [Anaerolineales bacterium]|nr:S24/S26 family peptidase [Anaerolineales bacterium]